MGVQSASGMASMALNTLWCWRAVMEKRTSILRQTATMAWMWKPLALLALRLRSWAISTPPVPAAMARSGYSPAGRHSCGAERPPLTAHRFRREWSPGRWSTCHRLVLPQQTMLGRTNPGSPDPVGARGPNGNSGGRSPSASALSVQSPTAGAEATNVSILSSALARSGASPRLT